MMTRINSSKLAKLKTIFVLPLVVILLMAFTINTSKDRIFNKNQLQNQSSVNSKSKPSIFPVKKGEGVNISAGYGMMIDPFSKKERMHNAVDIKAPEGTSVYATADGMIRKVELSTKGYGKFIIIDHEGGYSTLYSHLSGYNVNEGQEIKQGEVIGFVGNTGRSTAPHLHYEVMKDGENIDPSKYF